MKMKAEILINAYLAIGVRLKGFSRKGGVGQNKVGLNFSKMICEFS